MTLEEPYLIDAIVGHGAYQLSIMDDVQVLKSWNAIHFKMYHM